MERTNRVHESRWGRMLRVGRKGTNRDCGQREAEEHWGTNPKYV